MTKTVNHQIFFSTWVRVLDLRYLFLSICCQMPSSLISLNNHLLKRHLFWTFKSIIPSPPCSFGLHNISHLHKFQTNDTRLISCSESAPTRISKTWGKQRNSSPCWRTTTSRSSTRTPSTPSNHCSGSASSEQLKHGGSSSRQCLSSLVLQFCILHEPTVLSSCPYSSSHSPSVGSLAILGETCT